MVWLDPVRSALNQEEEPACIDSLISDPLILCDGRSWVECEEEDEIPNEAEAVTVDGKAAWLSKGDTYWELRQGPYKVTVANVAEEGKASHFFGVGFVIPDTRKRYSGYFDHAPGHVDRETFLNVAGRIAVGLRKTYG